MNNRVIDIERVNVNDDILQMKNIRLNLRMRLRLIFLCLFRSSFDFSSKLNVEKDWSQVSQKEKK